jgi:hypothetical protein
MMPPRLLLLLAIAFVLCLLGVGWGIYWYLFGTNEIDSAELVPANTVFFASIPNAAAIVNGYESSKAKALIESPNFKPLMDYLSSMAGTKNVGLLQDLLPNLSGQSFIAVTHFDYDNPAGAGLIAAMKPKPGTGDFGSFLEKLKATWPDIVRQGETGKSTVEGVNYDWIRGPGAPDKICVAQIKGWIVTSWGEASLQDWIERFRKVSTTSSLAKDLDYQKSLTRVGDNPMTLVYVNFRSIVEMVQQQVAKTNPAESDYLGRKLSPVGGATVATRFEDGEIVDRFSFLIPHPAQLDAGLADEPCSFETLKFTGPDTRFYWASNFNWKQNDLFAFLQDWVHRENLDPQQNIVDALGPELSVQAEWDADQTYPEIGLFVKLDKPDDFKPTIAAIIDSMRKTYANSAVINELKSNGQDFAALQFVQSSLITPTITEDGPYLGVFLTENQAVRSFQRDPTLGLTHRADFNTQVGDRRNGAAQILFLDSPYMLDRAYRTAMPYVSLAGMFNKNLAALIQGRDLPDDLSWLAPIGAWSCVVNYDEEGVQVYSVSGIGNQGILVAGAMGAAASVLQTMGFLPKLNGLTGLLNAPPSPAAPPSAVMPPAPNPTPAPALPPSVGHSNAANLPSTSTIYITSESKIVFDDTIVPEDQFGIFLKTKKAENPDLKLVVKVDKDALPDVLSTVMDAGASAGFGVLPYSYETDPNPLPSATNSDETAPASPMPAPANASPAPGPGTNGAAPTSIPLTNANPDAAIPGPLQPQ